MVGEYLKISNNACVILVCDLGKELPYVPQLEMVYIYFETATFDLIEKDTKNTLETQISVVGGTMGLFTGFSILSAVEILYFTIKYFMSLRHKSSGKISLKSPQIKSNLF